MKLHEIGEFRLLQEYIFPEIRRVFPSLQQGHDCSFFSLSSNRSTLCVTTDVGPRPLATALTDETDFHSWGWYTVVCNLSDIAAAGGKPEVFVNSIDAHDEMDVADLVEFVRGMVDACMKFGIKMAGGNIRTAPKFSCHGFAIGSISSNERRELAAKDGDRLYVVGPAGHFISAFLEAQVVGLSKISSKKRQRLLRPKPLCIEVSKLIEKGLIRTASDNSDGLLGSVWNIAKRSACKAIIDFSSIKFSPTVRRSAAQTSVNPLNIFCFWGDWNMAVAIPFEMEQDFLSECKRMQIQFSPLGHFVTGQSDISGIQNGKPVRVNIVRNENFVRTGFNTGVIQHVQSMLHSRIIQSE